MKLKIKTELELSVPSGTKVIRNDQWLTLARKSGMLYKIITLHIDDVRGYDFNNEDNWIHLNVFEVKSILKLV